MPRIVKKRFFLILPPERIRFRNEFRLLGVSKIKDFVVQLEVEISPGYWGKDGVVRYDIKHGYFHRDLINPNGLKIEHTKIRVSGLREAVVAAIDDLKENLETHLKKAGYDKVVNTLPSPSEMKDYLESAKQFLIRLVEHPDQIDKVPNKVSVIVKDELKLKNSVTVIKRDKTGKIINEGVYE